MSQAEVRDELLDGGESVGRDDLVIDLRDRSARPAVQRPAAPELAPSTTSSTSLKALLIGMDALAVAVAWSLWTVAPDLGQPATTRDATLVALLAMAVTMATVAGLHLYRASVCAVHAQEVLRLGRAVALTAVIVQASKGVFDSGVPAAQIALGSGLSYLALLLSRRVFRGWLRNRRRRGHHLRPVVVVGTNEEGRALVATLRRNPQAGYAVVGVLGDRSGVATDGDVPWLGPASDCAEVVSELGANGAFLAASALSPSQLNRSARQLIADGRHVHLSSSLRGIAARRIRLQPISREMHFYLEPARLRRWQGTVKRAIDLGLASLLVAVSAPVLLVCAVVIRVQDGGPVLFCQERVGRNGKTFTLFKLRTMVPDAERRLSELSARNERDSVLFKLDRDPRVTTFGKVLRALSLDELPQLLNVLRGEMSLVGPRPALPAEVARFDERLQARHEVLPGITGLWQVEAREVADLGAYTRLDLFYVENWSVGLDLAIMISTVGAILGRAARILVGRVGSTG